MKNSVIKKLIFLLFVACSAAAQDGKFTFNLPVASTTSAGVYQTDGTLIRTLWSNEKLSGGAHAKFWDGNTDAGVKASAALSYQVKVISHNISYSWQGTIGNNSDSLTGAAKHRGYYRCMSGLAFGPTYGYYCMGYSEGAPSLAKFSIANPRVKIPIYGHINTGDINYVSTDGNYVYWGGFDPNAAVGSFVFATRVADDVEVKFTAGATFNSTFGRDYPYAISIVSQPNALISGMAVQKTGNYLFVARAGINQLQVINKATGSLIRTLSYNNPKGLSTDGNDDLWMITGKDSVMKYTVNVDGSLSAPVLKLFGVQEPLATQVSPDGTQVSVADGGQSQQLKSYNNTTGGALKTMGTAGGYFQNPSVSDNKFYFNDVNGTGAGQHAKTAFVAYQPDGSFWVNDPGNFRVQHFTAAGAFSDNLMWLGATYFVGADKTNINRVFSDFLEFEVDYSVQNLSGKSGWKLKNNWGASVSSVEYHRFPRYITTLSNGRTYGLIRKGKGNDWEVIEFPATGKIRFTGIVFLGLTKLLCSDGSLQDYTLVGTKATYKRYPLTGFNALGDPQWSTVPEILASAPIDNIIGSPVNYPNGQVFSTTTNKIALYNHKAWANNAGPVFSTGYHMGIMNKGSDDKWLVKSEKSTHRNYLGDYPKPGWFDCGNMVNDFAGSNLNIIDRQIITGYHGEFWKNGQTNKYNHYFDNGLPLGQFGTTRTDVGFDAHAAAMMAGNALSPTLVKDAVGDLYLWHGDESDHSALHRWKITNINSIVEQSVPIIYPTAFAPEKRNFEDLMVNLPFDSTLANNTAGWTRYPALDTIVNKFTDNWSVVTSVLKYEKGIDLFMRFSQPTAQVFNVSRDLGADSVKNDWKITGNVVLVCSGGTLNGQGNNAYIDVLDINGKILTTFYGAKDLSLYPTVISKVFGNTSQMFSMTSSGIVTKEQNFEIIVNKGVATFKYGSFTTTTALMDASGNWRRPKTLRFRFVSKVSTQNYNVRFDVSDLKLYRDVLLAPVTNKPPVAFAGPDQVVSLPVTTTNLEGSGTDSDGNVVSYSWTKLAGPNSGYLGSPATAVSGVVMVLPGVYKYQLTVTDNEGAIGRDTIEVTLNPAQNKPPVADAGADQAITLPSNNTTLTGVGADADGFITNYEWAKISGPTGGLPSPTNTTATVITNLTEGTYQYQFIVKDDAGAITRDTIVITVYPVGNQAPVANAGEDIAIALPVNRTTVTGAASDIDGTISSYSWSQLSGPAPALIASPNAASSLISNLVEGAYEYVLTVQDDKGALSKDTLRITVNAVSNATPTADAGADVVITQPLTSATLKGGGIDTDGTITNYGWTLLSGPTVAGILSPAAATTIINNLAVGVYEFELQVKDNKGAISSDTVQVMVLGLGNQAPKANAGFDQSLNLPANVTTLTGEGIDDDGAVVSYQWRRISGPVEGTIAFPSAASTAIENLIAGTYIFELIVTDNKGAIGKDSVVITVNAPVNLAPVVNAGADIAILLPQNSISLPGIANDTDGTIALVTWKQISGPAAGIISQPGQLVTTVTNLEQGIYEFELSVTDNAGAVATDIIQVTVGSVGNKLPEAAAGNDQEFNLPVNSMTLSGTAIDLDGTVITYAWRKVSGPDFGLILNPNSAVTLVTNLEPGEYYYELTVTDDMGGISSDTVKITVKPAVNEAPKANAGDDITVTLPANSTTLAGMGTDVDGTIAAYNWSKLSGPAAGSIVSPNTALTALNSLTEGTYTYILTITDNAGATANDTIVIKVLSAPNQGPRADAGANIVITLPLDSAALNGSAVDDDGTITGYSWKMISGAVGAGLKNANNALATATSLKAGQYLFELTVTDDDGAVSADTVQVTVNPAINIAPVANAGADIFISLPINSTLLAGVGTDADGTIASYSWTKLSGPAAGNLAAQNTALASLTGLVQVTYSFELTVTDNAGAVSKDVVNVTVIAQENKAPVANAGADQVVQLPATTTTFTGSGIDTDGTITTYTWAKISGPASGVITSPTSPVTTLTNLTEGTYYYQLIIRDNSGATAKDTVQVIVKGAPNMAPLATAGPDQIIALPKTDVTLSGDASDVDGTISTYAWRKISGPVSGTIASAGSGITSVINLVQGIYKFEFTVKDDKGATTSDTMQVTVTAVQNELPTADAGKDQDVVLPINTTTLAGNANDLDGFITTYLWRKISGPSAGTIATPSSATSAVNSLVKGIYLFEFTVTDNGGAVAKDTIRVSVNDFNNRPVANAGANQTITLPTNSTTLNGGGTDVDGTISSYVWLKISGPAAGVIATPGTASTDLSSLVQGLYEFELTVTDDDGAIAKDTVQVTVNDLTNKAPVANAGSNKTITLPVNTTTLSGSGTDADGTVASYSWVMISGPAAATIVTPNAAITTINNLIYGTYKFELTVTDDQGAISKDVVEVAVLSLTNVAPVANAGTDQVIIWPKNNTILHGTGTDPDGTITRYSWTKVSGPQGTITSPNSSDPTLKNLVQGVYVYQLTVRDNDGATSTDLVQITVTTSTPTNNIAPVANAGTNKTINLPVNTTTLNGSGTDLDGTISSYAWTKLSGPAGGTITSPASGTSSVNGLEAGVYQFVLTVKDNLGATAKDTVQVTVIALANEAPLADAGMDQSIYLPVDFTTLYGIGIDPDGTISSYNWRIISGPAAGNIFSQNSATTAAGDLVEGVYGFELTVTDNNGAIGKDTLMLTVFAPDNQAPVANAGSARRITLPTNSVTFNGTGTDGDGTIVSYGWIQLSGPSAATIAAGNAPDVTVTNLVEGIYQFELTVTDNLGAIARDIVEVTVVRAVNQAPVADAGTDKTISLPVDNTTLVGRGTDADGTIAAYKWTRISGPAAGIIATANEAGSLLTNMVEGVYQYQLTVTDNDGASSKDTITITVLSAPNQAPVANAGTNRTITLPVNTTTLEGAGSDTDGNVVGYAWVKISGPAAGNIASPNSFITSLNNLLAGTYTFQLTVTDDDGATSTDEVTVTVNPAANQAPVANAGSDKVISLPVRTVTFTGTGDDADGTIASFEWTKISGPVSGTIASPNTATTSTTKLDVGFYLFELKVTDNDGAVSRDTVQVSVYAASNLAPVAYAGMDRTITLPVDTISVQGTGTDADGSVVAFQWSKIAGPNSGYITWTDSYISTIIDLTEGVYLFQLAVTDDHGATATDTVKITVLPAVNKAPVADAGLDKIIRLPTNSTTLAGAGIDEDGTVVTYNWVKLTGPAAGIIGLPNAAITALNGLVEGVYTYQLTVTDNKGATAMDTIKVTVNAANIAPVAKAGIDQVITLPVNTVTLTGAGTDSDGNITDFAWHKLSGPSAGTIASSTSATTAVSSLEAGIYYFQLAVTDNSGLIAYDTVIVTVKEGINLPPVADAGSDLVINLPTNSSTFQGSGVDADGAVVSYSWRKISGSSATLASPTLAVTAVNNLVEGIYKYELSVTDDKGATAKDTVVVSVNASPNLPPVANAGTDKVLILPVNGTSLNGAGSDADGAVASYKWSKVAGPAAGKIVAANAATTAIEALVEGVYQFELLVTDNRGGIARDTVKITVDSVFNQLPVSLAGPDQVITLPKNKVTLTGSGTDADGKISSYSWVKISGPASGTIAAPFAATTEVAQLVEGVYVYKLTVTDNLGGISRDTVKITVQGEPKIAPVALAGADADIVLPENKVLLSGSGKDADGVVVKYSWKVLSGPSDYVILSADSAKTAIENLFQGIYEVELAVTDNKGNIGKDTMKITVSSPRLAAPTDGVKLYPNPVTTTAKVDITTAEPMSKVSITLNNTIGMQVKYTELLITGNHMLYELDMANLKNGYYFVTVRYGADKKTTFKVLKTN